MLRKLSVIFLALLLTSMSVQPVFAADVDIEDLLVTILKEAIKEVGKEGQEKTPEPSQNDGGAVRGAYLVKVAPREGAAVRDTPSVRGKIITKGAEGIGGPTLLYVEPQPISNEGSSWYRAYFISNFGIDLCQVKYMRSIWQGSTRVRLDNVEYLYVNTRDAQSLALDDDEKKFFALFDRGRPAEFKVGDKVRTWGDHRADKTIVPIKLYQEPNKNSKTSVLPAGSLILDLMPGRMHNTGGHNMHLYPLLGLHIDMRDHFWNAIIDAGSMKVLGWADDDEHSFIGVSENSGDYPLPPLPRDIYRNYDKIFKY